MDKIRNSDLRIETYLAIHNSQSSMMTSFTKHVLFQSCRLLWHYCYAQCSRTAP